VSFTKFALLPILPLGAAACTDLQDPLTPSVQDWSRAVSVAAAPVVVYSNFGPGMAYDHTYGWRISDTVSGMPGELYAVSQRFTPTADYTFTSAQFPIAMPFGGSAILPVVLQADVDGKPGRIIEEFIQFGQGTTPSIVTAFSVLQPILQSGTHYWLTVMPVYEGYGLWSLNSTGDALAGNFASTHGGPAGPWVLGPGSAQLISLNGCHDPKECELPISLRSAFQINGLPLTAQDIVGRLMDDVHALVTGGSLNPGQAAGLAAKLSAVIESLNRGSTSSACNQLGAFANQVRALMNAHKLTPGAAQNLIDTALWAGTAAGCDA
jgi:hypothetical protein